MEKKKSKTNLLQKFADKFKKKKRAKSTSASRERSSEMSRRPSRNRSPSKKSGETPKSGGTPSASAETKSKIEMMEVSAKGLKSKKETKEKRTSDKKKNKEKEKDKEKDKEKENTVPLTKTSSTLTLRRADSLMELSQNSRIIEKTVKTWIENLEKTDFRKTMTSDFQPIETMKVEGEKCEAFKKNVDICQSENVEVLDSNRVKGNGEADFFYHGSVLNLSPITTKTTILAQLADIESPQSLESFWLMVAGQKIQRVYVLMGPGDTELDQPTRDTYFNKDFAEFKTIRVNNRNLGSKQQQPDDGQTNTQLYYEVVPKDCAEAPFCMIEICDFWIDAKIPVANYGRIAATAASVFETDIDADAACAIVSNYGAGRAGAFLVGALAIEKLRNGEQPNIKDIALMVRSQRPAAIETLSQYIFTYIIALYYGMKHVKDEEMKKRIQEFILKLKDFGVAQMAEEDEDESNTSTNSNTLE